MLLKRLLALTLFVALAPASSLRAQWVPIAQSVGDIGDIESLTVKDSILFATGENVMCSHDNGVTWTQRNIKRSPWLDSYALCFSKTFVLAGGLGAESVWKSTDTGASWSSSGSGINGADVYGIVSSGTSFIASASDGIFLSTDSGLSWSDVSNAGQYLGAAFPIAANGPNVFAATQSGLLRSTDSGLSWTTLLAHVTWSVAVRGNTIFAAADSGIYRSTNNGDSWARADTFAAGLLYVYGNYLFIGPVRTNTDHVFLSTDDGSTFSDLGSRHRMTSLVVSGSNVVVGSNNVNISYRPLIDLNAGITSDHMPVRMDFCSYPNPFSHSTTISFTPETSGYADVSIVNPLGVEIAHLFSGEVAAGNHSFTWNPAGMPDGMYECVARMNGSVQTIPLMLNHS